MITGDGVCGCSTCRDPNGRAKGGAEGTEKTGRGFTGRGGRDVLSPAERRENMYQSDYKEPHWNPSVPL